jgi:hypothetical protein
MRGESTMSNYAICNMSKFNSGSIGKLGKHIDRKNLNYSNQQIDTSKSYLNVSLVEDHRPLPERVQEEIDQNYTYNRKIQSNAVLLNGFIVTASDEYMDSLERHEKIQYFKDAKEYFDKEYGHVVTAEIHFDETNPHMHLGFVPLVEAEINGKKCTTLSSRRLFGKPHQLSNFHTDFTNYMQDKGYNVERGKKKSEREEPINYVDDIEKFKKQHSKKIIDYIDNGMDYQMLLDKEKYARSPRFINAIKTDIEDNIIKNKDYTTLSTKKINDRAYRIAEDLRKEYPEKEFSDEEIRVVNHFTRKALYKALNQHNQVFSQNGYYEFLSEEKAQERRKFYEFVNQLKYNKPLLNKTLNKLDKVNRDEDQEVVYQKLKFILNKKTDDNKAYKKAIKDLKYSNTQTYCFSKKDREVIGEALGKEIKFNKLYDKPLSLAMSKGKFVRIITTVFSQGSQKERAQAYNVFLDTWKKKRKQQAFGGNIPNF